MDSVDAPQLSLYYFNPNTYGQQWFVMAASREEAIAAVKSHVRDYHTGQMERTLAMCEQWPAYYPPREVWEKRERETIERAVAEIDDYANEKGDGYSDKPPCIEVYGRGYVIESEIS